MEIKKINSVDIYINNNKADIFSQDDLNLRFNNTFTDPSKIQTIQTEYSFSFTLPVTPTNEKIFDFANIPSKRNKFNKHYKTNINVDGLAVFDGDLIVQSVSKEGYKCNLYVNRLNTVEKIFGESTLNEISDWEVDYDQDITINSVNNISDINYDTSDVFYPLVSYGMFQKIPKEDSEFYTSKFDIDKYSRIYNENFYPSINLLKLVEKCFNMKGYEVDGDIFDDKILKRIYISTKLGGEQDPIYNYGKPSMGRSKINFTYNNFIAEQTDGSGSRVVTEDKATFLSYDLERPKFQYGKDSTTDQAYYNWTSNNVYDIWSANEKFLELTPDVNRSGGRENKLLWRDNRFVAPCNGYYKIDLNVTLTLTGSTFSAYGYGVTANNNRDIKRVAYTPSFSFDNFFTEVQLVKNSEDGMNCKMITPDAIDNLISGTIVSGQTFTPTVDRSDYNLYSAYPHQSEGTYTMSTDKEPYPLDYVPKSGETLAYDTSVNKDFICGFCCSGPYLYNSVIRNGKSWSSTCSDVAKSRYDGDGYYGIKLVSGDTSIQNPDGTYRRGSGRKREAELTDYGKNTLPNSTNTISKNGNQITSHIQCIVYLQKNDYLQLKLVERKYENKEETDYDESERNSANAYRKQGKFQDDANVKIVGSCEFECFSPDDIGISNDYFNWNNESRFPKMLDLSSFLTNDEKMSDFINNFIKEFNLSYQQNGKNITLNKQFIDFKTKNAVDLSDRVSRDEIEMEAIEYPSQMSVQYTINEEERGFYISAERNATDEQIQSNDWKEFADRGYDVIHILEDEYADESKVQTKTSYDWYEDFNIKVDTQNATIPLPIIAKDEWMIDGYNDAEMMKQDGYGLNRRYWFPSVLTSSYVYLHNDNTRKVFIKKCSNVYDNVDLSYKLSTDNADDTLLTRYFNIFYDSGSNYIKFECYLSTEEYLAIKNGANVIVDDDVYIPTEIKGYDCSGNNMTEIIAIKK